MSDPDSPRTLADALRRAMAARGIGTAKGLAGAIRKHYNETGRRNIKTVHYQTILTILNGGPADRGPQPRGLQMLGEYLKGDAAYFMPWIHPPGRKKTVREGRAGSLSPNTTGSEELVNTTLATEGARLPYTAHEIAIHAKVRVAMERHSDRADVVLDVIENYVNAIIRDGLPKTRLRSGGDSDE